MRLAWQSGPDGRLLTVDDHAWKSLTGLSWRDEWNADVMDWIHPEDRDRYTEAWIRAHRERTPLIAGCRCLLPNSLWYTYRTHGIPRVGGGMHGHSDVTLVA